MDQAKRSAAYFVIDAQAATIDKTGGYHVVVADRKFAMAPEVDTTKFVEASIHEVYMTLLEAGVLVLIVIMVFLQDWRALLIPATTVPVTTDPAASSRRSSSGSMHRRCDTRERTLRPSRRAFRISHPLKI